MQLSMRLTAAYVISWKQCFPLWVLVDLMSTNIIALLSLVLAFTMVDGFQKIISREYFKRV
jgi:hypothetical protein